MDNNELKNKLINEILSTQFRLLEESGFQEEARITSPITQGAYFAFGAAAGAIYKVFKEMEDHLADKSNAGMIQLFEIWSEGFNATGESAPAYLMGEENGKTFQDACDKFFDGNSNYNSEQLTHWGCRLFDNAAQAMESFG